LDRLDDGWKPFWLDTLAIDPGRPAHSRFQPNMPDVVDGNDGDGLAAPRLLRWYIVE